MADSEVLNLPDVLGAMTGGQRVNLDVVQAALGMYPPNVPAGRTFELVLLLQNATNMDIDVTAQIKLPKRDAKKGKNPFSVQKEKLVIGLREAEFGYLSIPVATNEKMAPAQDYSLSVNLSVKRLGKGKPTRIRAQEGGGPFAAADLNEEARGRIGRLRKGVFSANKSGRSAISLEFGVAPGKGKKPSRAEVAWHSLWSMRDYVDARQLAMEVQAPLEALENILTHQDAIFFPLLDAIQTRFTAGGYQLRAGEAVFAAKALTLMVVQGIPNLKTTPIEDYPTWFVQVCKLLFDKPQVLSDPGQLFSETLFDNLLYDAMRRSMMMVSTVTDEDLGSRAEQEAYIAESLAVLENGEMEFSRAYLPLIYGGLIANTRVVMPREKPRETINLLDTDLQRRGREKNEATEPLFAMATELIDRALNQTG